MLSHEQLQSRVAQSVLTGRAFELEGILSGAEANARFSIYENNTRASLTATLMTVFPVTVRLVDERFFRYAASRFISRHPPSEPRLACYGSAFPEFLRGFDGLAGMPFVAETARLEWAIAEALDNASLPACTLAQAQAAGSAIPHIRLQPSLRLVISRWPVFSIWKAHQGDDVTLRPGGWRRVGERIALWRQGEDIRFMLMTASEFAFRRALVRNADLERASVRALARDPMFDLAKAIARLFGDGLVSGIDLQNT